MSSPPPAALIPAPPPVLPREGDILDEKYRIERIIGSGGMGLVVAARHIELDERVAIKMLLPHLTSTGEPAARFVREARAAIKIKSQHVVRVLDVGRTDGGSPYIVMEYLDGCDLAQLLERGGPLALEDAVFYVMQACEAIAAAHALGIVHRDLKPANLFLTTSNEGMPCLKVLDFGISKITDLGAGHCTGLTSTSTVMGTPAFMSPEQLRSTRDVDARTDIWSLGAILHALMTGSPPYDGESNADVSAKIIRDAPTPLRVLRPDATEALEAVVLRCLEKDRDRRFPDVASLASELASVSASPSSRLVAARVARIAAAVAPTLLSLPPAVQVAPLPGAGATPGPTRTASAWADSRPEEKRGRRVAGMLAGAGLVTGAIVFGVVRWQAAPAPTVASAVPAERAMAAPVVTATPGDPRLLGTTPVPPSSIAPAASDSADDAHRGEFPPLPRTTARPPVRKGWPSPSAASAKPPPTPSAAKPAAGLFEGRE